MSMINRLKLIVAGIFAGIILNSLFSVFIGEYRGFVVAIPVAIFVVVICAIWFNEKRLGIWHKLRLVFFGVSATSFSYALFDVLKFVLTYGPNSILVYNGPPYLTVGGISFFSILYSFAIGGFFSVAGGILDLHEKKDFLP